MKVNITLKGIAGVFLNLVFIFWIYLVWQSKEMLNLLLFILERIGGVAPYSNYLTWINITLFFCVMGGISFLILCVIFVVNGLCFKPSKEEKEIEEAKRQIRLKYKIIREERRLKRLKEKKWHG